MNATFAVVEGPAASTVAKLTDPGCVDPDLSRVATDQTMMLCDGTVTSGMLDLQTLTADNLKVGVKIAGITGAYSPDFPSVGSVLSSDTVNGVDGSGSRRAP